MALSLLIPILIRMWKPIKPIEQVDFFRFQSFKFDYFDIFRIIFQARLINEFFIQNHKLILINLSRELE